MSRKLDADDYAQVQEVFEAFLEEMDRETAKFSRGL